MCWAEVNEIFWRIVVLCFLGIVITSIIIFAAFWNSAGENIEQSGIESRSQKFGDKPLTTAEVTISKVVFNFYAEKETSICPAFSNLFFSKSNKGMGVSGHLAKQLLIDGKPTRHIEFHLESLFLACHLETEIDQKVILREYLSKAYFGAGEYGIDKVSQSIFKKPVSVLTEDESLALAALVQFPQLRNNPEQWLIRKEKLKVRLKG